MFVFKSAFATITLAASALLSLALASPASAQPPMIEIIPATAAAGAQYSYGACPCFRWSVRVQAAGGQIETKDFLISSEALFKMEETTNPTFLRYASRLFTVGAIEALWKGGHVGLGFSGVTLGEDRDRGYSDLIRTGLYALVNLVRRDSIRLDIRSGYQFEQMRVNLGPSIEHHELQEGAVLHWNAGRWSGNVAAQIGMDPEHFSTDQLHLSASAAVHMRMFSIGDLQAGLGLNVGADHDPFRELLGMPGDNYTAGLYMDLSYVDVIRRGNE